MTIITNLKTEYQVNPVGIDVESPRFSWNMESEVRGAEQKAYRIQVATSEYKLKANQLVWDSGIIHSGLSIGISYTGEELLPSMRYYWVVQVWSNTENQAVTSEIAFFETGLMSCDGVKNWDDAKWITQPGPEESPPHVDRRLLKSYDIHLDFQIKERSAGIIFSHTDQEEVIVRITADSADPNHCLLEILNSDAYQRGPYTFLGGEQYTAERGPVKISPVELTDFEVDSLHHLKIAVREGSPVLNIPGSISIYLDDLDKPVLSTPIARYSGSHKGGRVGFYNPDSSCDYRNIIIEQPEFDRPNMWGPPIPIPYVILTEFQLDGEKETFVKYGTDEAAVVKRRIASQMLLI